MPRTNDTSFDGFDFPNVPLFDEYPVIKDVTIAGNGAASDDDVTLSRFSLLSRLWDRTAKKFKYYGVSDWDSITFDDAIDTGIIGNGQDTAFIGYLDHLFIDATRVNYRWDDGTGNERASYYIVNPNTGKFCVKMNGAGSSGDALKAWYHYGDQQGLTKPVAILNEAVKITSIDDIDDVPVFLLGKFKQGGLNYFTDDVDEIKAYLTIMAKSKLFVFKRTVQLEDTSPDNFSFDDVTGASRSTEYTSNTITVRGITEAVDIMVTAAGTLIVDGVDFTGTTVENGQRVAVKLTSSSMFNTETVTTVTIGGISSTYSLTTSISDTTPDSFSFDGETDSELSTEFTSNVITVAGIEAPSEISITGNGTLVVNDDDTFAGTTVEVGDTVAVKLTASTEYDTTVSSTVTIGGVSSTFSVRTRVADMTPDSFSFVAETGSEVDTEHTSNAITVSDIEASAAISVSGSGTLVVNGNDFSGTTVEEDDTVAVKLTSSAEYDTSVSSTVTIGSITSTFTITTREADLTPDSFSFTDVTEADPSTETTSDAITVSGIEDGVSISATTGGTLVVDGVDFTGTEVDNGQEVAVKITSSASYDTTVQVTVTIGGVSDIFSVRTRMPDVTPDQFTFTDQDSVERSTQITSDGITVDDIEESVAISLSGDGTLIVNDSVFSGTEVSEGQIVKIRITSSSEFGTALEGILTIGGVTDTFTVTTRNADTTPDSFSFTAETGVETDSEHTSNAITVADIEESVDISITANGTLVVNGDDTFAGTTIEDGDTVAIKITASSLFDTTVSATVTIGGVTATYSVTTREADTTPDSFAFTAVTAADRDTEYTSNDITVAGIEASSNISVTSTGTLVVNGDDTFAGTTIEDGDTVAVKLTSSNGFLQDVSAIVTIGGVSATYTVTTGDLSDRAFSSEFGHGFF